MLGVRQGPSRLWTAGVAALAPVVLVLAGDVPLAGCFFHELLLP